MKVLEPLGLQSRSRTVGAFSWSQEGIWSKIAAHETMFQVLMMERMLSNERQLRISQSA